MVSGPADGASSAPPAESFARRTWHGAQLDVDDLLAGLGGAVSVVIPALDEQDTVAAVVATATELHRTGLVDEVVVIDGGSSDATRTFATAAGARVEDQAAALQAAGPGRGKGDALWKGLALTRGAYVVFVDADVHEPSASTITGLLAPFVLAPELQLVKAAYDRTLTSADSVAATGGGRVTELMARPLLAALWPQLAWLAQPLASEYAGRRAALESVPFVQGYGVELALLVDVAARYGADAIGQVDLGHRTHRHQPLPALGRMASEILHVALSRARVTAATSMPVLPQPARDRDGRLTIEVHEVSVAERPPLATWRERAMPRD